MKRAIALAALAVSARVEAQPAKDPFAPEEGSGSSSGPGSGSASPDSTTATAVPSKGCEYITKETCSKSNTSQYVTSGAYVFGSVLVFSVVRMWWNRKGTSTIGVRLLVTMALAAIVAGVLVALDPARGQDLRCCVETAVFKGEVFLSGSAPGRVAVLGVVPAVVLFFLVTLVEGVVRRR